MFILASSYGARERYPPTKSSRIEVDEDQNEICLVVDGEVAATLTKDGLHVVNNISYGGTVTDTGTEGQADPED